MPIRRAATFLEVSPTTLRRWIAEGAPTVRPGQPGRGNGALVVLEDIRAWRGGRLGDAGYGRVLERIGESLLDTVRRDAGLGAPAHVLLGIPERAAATLLVTAFARVSQTLTGDETVEPPEPVKQLYRIAERPGRNVPRMSGFRTVGTMDKKTSAPITPPALDALLLNGSAILAPQHEGYEFVGLLADGAFKTSNKDSEHE